MFVVLDQGALFVLCLLVAGFLAGIFCVLLSVFLAIQKVWRHVRDKRDQGLELKQEQARAVAVAEAHVRQHFYDNGSGQGARI